MSSKEYIYAIARIKSKETKLLDSSTIEQLILANSLEGVMKILKDKGWGDSSDDYEEMLNTEIDRTWEFVSEIVDDLSVLDVLRVEKDFHNLKTVIKAEYSKKSVDGILQKYGSIPLKDIQELMVSKDLNFIPHYMHRYATKAYNYMMETGDSQLCDVILDRGAVEVMLKLAKECGNTLLMEYARLKAVTANIKIAIRGARTRKIKQFFDLALIPCDDLNIELLKNAAMQGLDGVYSYLETTSFAGITDKIKEDFTAFETWADNQIIDSIKKEKYTSTTLSPIVAYIIARENEIKVARIIMVAKKNNIPVEEIRKRMRDMYV